jgi:alcohol dehydrogenase class IV
MQIASCMAGIAFNSAGLGITHSIAHAFGAMFHLPHGLANAIVLPYVIKFNGQDDKVQHQYARLLSGSGILNVSGNATETLYNSVVALSASLNIPVSLKASGVSEADYLGAREEMLDKAMADICTTTNPVAVTREKLKGVMDQTYYGV